MALTKAVTDSPRPQGRMTGSVIFHISTPIFWPDLPVDCIGRHEYLLRTNDTSDTTNREKDIRT